MTDPAGMQTHGFEILRQVLSESDAEAIAKESLGEMKRRPHMAHSDAIWKLRTHPRVVREFVRLWGGDTDLVTGFDGIGTSNGDFELPWHVDQTGPGRRGIQGIFALSVHDTATGGLQLLSGSHRLHDALIGREHEGASVDDWEYHEVGHDIECELFRGCEVVTPHLRPGDLCVWDSRTVHRVIRGDGTKTRHTAYLSFEPRLNVPVYVGVLRRRAVRRGVATTHWASKCVDRGDHETSPPTTLTHAMMSLV